MKIGIMAAAAVLAAATTGCASIVSKSDYPTSFKSTPPGVEVTVTNEDGIDVAREKTPFNTTLKASNGFFNRMEYTATYHKACYQDVTVPLKGGIDGWYWANIALGGLIGLLIVDPATGAMFNVDEPQSVAMRRADSSPNCANATARLETRVNVPIRLATDR